jgi:hypothetical protein
LLDLSPFRVVDLAARLPGRVRGLWDDWAMSDSRGRSDSRTAATTASRTPARIRTPARRLVAGLVGRSRDVRGMSVVLAFSCGVLVAGLEIVRSSPQWGFTYGGALDGVLSQLAVTGPAAVLVAAATAANVLAGAIVLRWLGAPAFRNLSDVVLAGFAAAVVLDTAVLFGLGSLGFFGWPELLLMHVGVAVVYVATRQRRPLLAGPVRVGLSRPAAWWLIVVAVWAGPLIVQLASPAVPFMDVLPNHVAPVEHIRVFGDFSTMATSPSPIYGPSRLMLGYVALLGQLTTITNLHAILAEAAFALPLTIIIAIALRRLAGQLFGSSAAFWVLLTFPLTFTFMRIPDSRGTVVVFPLAAWALTVIATQLRSRRRGTAGATAGATGATPKPSRRPDIGLAMAIGGAILVHPLIGLVAATAAVGATILHPATLGRRLVPALGGGAVIAVPQVLTMAGIDAPSWIGLACLVAALLVAMLVAYVVGAVADRLVDLNEPTTDRISDLGRSALVLTVVIACLVIARAHLNPPNDPASETIIDFPGILWLTLGGAALSMFKSTRGWVLLGCGITAGLAAWAASSLVGSANLTQQAVHYEVPKSVEYWLPVMLAIGAAGALATVWRLRWLGFARQLAMVPILVLLLYPWPEPLATNVQIGEHRGAESVGLALREAERGYWNFGLPGYYPDSRLIIDAPRQEVVDAIRAEESAGRLGPKTGVLHIASSFQQWVSVPVGVFTGAIETSISLQPEVSIHTDGGRLYGFARLDGELAAGYGYVVLEPTKVPAEVVDSTKASILAAGYHQIWANTQAIIYARD